MGICREILLTLQNWDSTTPNKRKESIIMAKTKKTDKVFHNWNDLKTSFCAETPHDFGRSLYKYTDCGPTTSFLVADEEPVCYGDKEARTNGPWTKNIIGLKIGSIVEGSEVEVGPEELLFPFSQKDLDKAVNNINEEASFYWKRDNTDNYLIKKNDKNVAFTSWTEWDSKPFWDKDFSKHVITASWKKKIWDAIHAKRTEGWTGTFKLTVGPYEVEEYIDDCTF
jgi:hypothetical protein